MLGVAQFIVSVFIFSNYLYKNLYINFLGFYDIFEHLRFNFCSQVSPFIKSENPLSYLPARFRLPTPVGS